VFSEPFSPPEARCARSTGSTEPVELEALAFTLAERLSEWLKEFGFEVFDRDGNTNFMVLNSMQWHLNPRL
jgi:hypothetical protein